MVKIKQVTLNFGFGTVTFEEDELDTTLRALVTEMRNITSKLGEREKVILRQVMASSVELLVSSVFPGFQRDTPEHETLRKLRDAQFIKPAEGGSWRAEKHIVVKPFGRLMWQKIGEEKLFAK